MENEKQELQDGTNVQNGTPGNQDDQSGVAGTDVNDKNDNTDKGENQNDKLFTQSQVNTMMANEKRQGKSSVFKELGIDSKDEKMIAMVKSFAESYSKGIDPGEKLQKEEALRLEAEARAQKAETKLEAISLGAKSDFIDDIITIASSKLNDSNDLKTVLSDMKTKYPFWFNDAQGSDSNTTGNSGTGSSVSSSSNVGKNLQAIGSRLAAQRKEENKISGNFWKD